MIFVRMSGHFFWPTRYTDLHLLLRVLAPRSEGSGGQGCQLRTMSTFLLTLSVVPELEHLYVSDPPSQQLQGSSHPYTITLSHLTRPATVKEVYSRLSSPEASLLIRSYSFNTPVCFHIRSAESTVGLHGQER